MLLILISDLQSEQDIQGYETLLHKQNLEIIECYSFMTFI